MNIVVYVILIVALVAMLVMPYFTQKKKNQEYVNMLSSIKVGDTVKTAGGIIGRVNKISDKGEVKTFVLETGSKSEKSYLEMDMSMIYCVLNKTTKTADEKEEKTELAAEDIKTEKAEEVKAEEIETSKETKTEETVKPKKIRTSSTKKTTTSAKTSKK